MMLGLAAYEYETKDKSHLIPVSQVTYCVRRNRKQMIHVQKG